MISLYSALALTVYFVPRSEWGSNADTEAKILARVSDPAAGKTTIQIHHTAGIDTSDPTPNQWPYNAAVNYVRKLQWSRPDLGPMPYSENVAVSEDGKTVWLFEGRGLTKRGAHTAGHNVDGIGWGILGNLDLATPLPVMQAIIRALELRVAYLRQNGFPNLGLVKNWRGWNAWGHRDTAAKSCPGNNLYPLLASFRLDTREEDMKRAFVDFAFDMFPEDVTGQRTYWYNLADDHEAWQTQFAAAVKRGIDRLKARPSGLTETQVRDLIREARLTI